jgi:hypothetical protein
MAITYINPEINKAMWGPGPWDTEPDKISWTDKATGLPCLIVRNRLGSLCGYVAVEPGHPMHGKDYDGVPVTVHGGLTFAGSCNESGPVEQSVCHVPEPGKPGDVFWFGFDCAHSDDVSPVMRDYDLGGRAFGATYKPVGYVWGECVGLAGQLAAMVATEF